MSLPRALLLMLALLQATGMAEVMQRQICQAACRDAGCDDDCTPGSDSPSCPCHCPSLQSQVPPALAAVTIAPAARPVAAFDGGDVAPPSPDPSEILHVPRRTV